MPKDWTPFDLMEYLSYEKAAECFPTDYYLMSDGMFIRCVTDTGRIMLWCETDEEHRIKTIKQMSGNTPPIAKDTEYQYIRSIGRYQRAC